MQYQISIPSNINDNHVTINHKLHTNRRWDRARAQKQSESTETERVRRCGPPLRTERTAMLKLLNNALK